VIACGGAVSKGETAALQEPSVCDYYYNVLYGSVCSGPAVPSVELQRVQARFDQICGNILALPGAETSAGQLNACASALAAQGCDMNAATAPTPTECTVTGTLPSGAACESGFQCASGSCLPAASDAGSGNSTLQRCGTCAASIAVGQPCSSAGGQCEPGTICDHTVHKPVCTPVVYGDVGASCGSAARLCKTGLYCDSLARQCTAQQDEGAVCMQAEACKAPLVCLSNGGNNRPRCQNPGRVGASCFTNTDCATGLGCDPTLGCVTVTWVKSGEPCNQAALCLVGSCPQVAGVPNGVCPAIVADGQACTPGDTAKTCDTLSECVNGHCQLMASSACQ
jgi:hypothetical protein